MEKEDIPYNRRRSRVNAMYIAYIYEYNQDQSLQEILDNAKGIINDLKNNDEYALSIFNAFFKNRDAINKIIEKMSGHWKYENISAINKSILRIAISEEISQNVPHAVLVNEYIEIAKIYTNQDDYKYIHGVIGSIYDQSENLLSILS